MRQTWSVFLLAAAACASPRSAGVPDGTAPDLLDELRAAAGLPAPVPPALYVIDPSFGERCPGSVVVVDGAMLAIRIEDQTRLPERAEHLLLPVFDGAAIKGDAVVVRRRGELLLCRFFPRPLDNTAEPAVGDEAVVDWATSRQMAAAPQR